MLRSLKMLHGYTILAQDGDIGKVYDFYFEDDSWVVRYLVVDTGHWLPGRKVLVTPGALQKPDWTSHSLPVSLTKEQVQKSPNIDTDRTVSRQQEIELHQHFGWYAYWMQAGTNPWPIFMPPPEVARQPSAEAQKGDPHLRSAREVTGYHLQAKDGSIGHVADLIADDTSWDVRYLVVDTRNWLPGRQVLIAPQWLVQNINWREREVEVTVTRESVQNSPQYHPGAPANREAEEKLYDYYGRPAYWARTESKGQK